MVNLLGRRARTHGRTSSGFGRPAGDELVAAAAVCRLLLRVEVHGADGEPQVMALCEGTGAEPRAHSRRRRRVPAGSRRQHARLLLEQHQHVAVDAQRRPRTHVGHHLLTCTQSHGSSSITTVHH
ncbi:hypothetical protein D1007_54017 [Hordeum vulgare]|nr:hypothetical protein D1007_54017 [Hordeum vulgare]